MKLFIFLAFLSTSVFCQEGKIKAFTFEKFLNNCKEFSASAHDDKKNFKKAKKDLKKLKKEFKKIDKKGVKISTGKAYSHKEFQELLDKAKEIVEKRIDLIQKKSAFNISKRFAKLCNKSTKKLNSGSKNRTKDCSKIYKKVKKFHKKSLAIANKKEKAIKKLKEESENMTNTWNEKSQVNEKFTTVNKQSFKEKMKNFTTSISTLIKDANDKRKFKKHLKQKLDYNDISKVDFVKACSN